MIRDTRAVPYRPFALPMDWATDTMILLMRDELAQEVTVLHPSVMLEGSKRNGLWYVEREIKWRGLAKTLHGADSCIADQSGAGGGAGASTGQSAPDSGDSFAAAVGEAQA